MSTGVLSSSRLRGCVRLGLGLAAILCCPAPSPAQLPVNLNLLKPLAEDRAKVDVFSGPRRDFVRGKLLDVTDSTLVVDGRKGRTEVPAADVREVWSPGGARYRKPLIVGTSIGFGLGLLAKAGEGDCNDPTSLCATDGPFRATDFAIMTALGTAGGLGWAWWKRHPRHLLYLSPESIAEARQSLGASAANAQVRQDWLQLSGLQGGTVEVAQRGSASTLKGSVVSLTPDAVLLLVDGEPYVIRQAEVRKLWREPRASWWRVAAGSLYYGTVWSSLISVAACHADPETHEGSACFGRTFGITTGVFAVLTGVGVAKQRHDALAYDASRPAPAPRSTLMLQPLLGPRAVGVRGAFTF